MTCHDARERFSEWVDDALSPEERARVAAHLDECADCRRELDRVSGTVALLRRMERPRAPIGFVDRVLEAARPAPWPVRLLRKVFVPLRVKLPAEAAALLLVAGLAVYVFQRTPELQQAARQDVPGNAPVAQRERAPVESTVQENAGRVTPPAEAPRDSGSPVFRAKPEARRDSGAPVLQAKPDEPAAGRRAELADKSGGAAPAPPPKGAPGSSSGRRGASPEPPESAKSRDATDTKTERFTRRGPAPSTPEPAPAPIPKVSEAKERNAVEEGAARSAQPPAPSAPQSAPAARQAASSVQQAAPSAQQAASSVQQAAPATQQSASSAQPPQVPSSAQPPASSAQQAAPAATPPASAAATPALPSEQAPGGPSAAPAPAPVAPPAASPSPAPELARGDLAKPPGEADRLRLAAKRALPPPDVVGRLDVKDRESAERALGEVLARSGGTVVSRREESGATVLDVVVPEAASKSFAAELARLGVWSPAAPPSPPAAALAPRSGGAARSEVAPLVHFSLRLVQ